MGVSQKSTRTKTRRRIRDLDQIFVDLRLPRHLDQHKNQKAAEDLPGLGQHYCIECAKWYDTAQSLTTHQKAKTHRRRVKQLVMKPYSQEDAEAAIGIRTDNGPAQAVRDSRRTMDMGESQLEDATQFYAI